jgi:hypothetical protein
VTDEGAAALLSLPVEAVRWRVDRVIPFIVWRGERLRKRGDVLRFRGYPPAVVELVYDGHDAPFSWPTLADAMVEVSADFHKIPREGRLPAEVWRDVLDGARQRGAADRAARNARASTD